MVSDRDAPPTFGIELVPWPDQAHLRTRLAVEGVPRMLIVAADADPPEGLAVDEGWIRLPFEPRDLEARLHDLAQALGHQRGCDVSVDAGGVVHRGTRSAQLTAAEAAVVSALIAARGAAVPRDTLAGVVWPHHPDGHNGALEVLVSRLRRHLLGLGLSVRWVRGAGYVLVPSATTVPVPHTTDRRPDDAA